MKKLFYILFFALIPFIASSQFTSDLVVFNPTGETFKLFIGSSPVNNYFSGKVRVNDLETGYYTLNIVFQNQNIPDFNLNVYVEENSEVAIALIKNENNIFYSEIFEALNYANNSNIHQLPVDPQPDEILQGVVFCSYPMEDDAFDNAIDAIENQDFDGDKLTVAKQIAMSNCLLAAQVKQIMILMDFESSRLDFAEFAYTHTFDPNNYFIVNDAFDFSSSVKKLTEYISSL
ncbi:MAG: DUF4476 domain-containing protein [Bacteroidales bacterium]|nr:DUF4476 domain-containing protein [Bacteroidales bacterium]